MAEGRGVRTIAAIPLDAGKSPRGWGGMNNHGESGPCRKPKEMGRRRCDRWCDPIVVGGNGDS